MRILGLDPGSHHTGYGLVERAGARLQAVAFGRWSPARQGELPDRLGFLAASLEEFLDRFEPQVAVLESLFYSRNVRSLIVLAEARGALLATLARSGVQIHEVSPAEVKATLTGNGRATKQQVGRMVRLLLGLATSAMPVDASDALAVSVFAAQRLRWQGRVPRDML